MDADLTMSNLESTVYSQAPIGRNSTPNMPAKMNTSEAMLDKFCESGKGINFFQLPTTIAGTTENPAFWQLWAR